MIDAKSPWRNGGLWALFPVGLLGPLIAGQLYLVHRALSDPSSVVEEHYYAKAVSWDSRVAEHRANDLLGWQARCDVEGVSPGRRNASMKLVDRDGRPVVGAHVEADAFAVVRSDHTVHIVLSETEPGIYVGALNAARPGLWELSFRATRGAARFTSVARNDLPVEHP